MDLKPIYRRYLSCLNAQDWDRLGEFVADDVTHNGKLLGLSGYRKMLEQDFADIPDLCFNVELVISDGECLANRLRFDCTPNAVFLGVPVNGRCVSFHENVFYQFAGDRDRPRLVGHRQGGDRDTDLDGLDHARFRASCRFTSGVIGLTAGVRRGRISRSIRIGSLSSPSSALSFESSDISDRIAISAIALSEQSSSRPIWARMAASTSSIWVRSSLIFLRFSLMRLSMAVLLGGRSL
jgi:predicted ester cyclase